LLGIFATIKNAHHYMMGILSDYLLSVSDVSKINAILNFHPLF
jgi:hypothetical protein